MMDSIRLATVITTMVVLYAATPRALADANFVPLDGPFASACGYKIETSRVNSQVVIQISLNKEAVKSFAYAELTLKKGYKTLAETIVGLVRFNGGKSGVVKLTLDPQVFDGGELTINSMEIKDKAMPKNFAGFRLSLEKFLAQPKPSPTPEKGQEKNSKATPSPDNKKLREDLTGLLILQGLVQEKKQMPWTFSRKVQVRGTLEKSKEVAYVVDPRTGEMMYYWNLRAFLDSQTVVLPLKFSGKEIVALANKYAGKEVILTGKTVVAVAFLRLVEDQPYLAVSVESLKLAEK